MSKADIIAIARKIVARELDPLEGCRLMVGHTFALSNEDQGDQDITTLVGINSETDHFAMGTVRALWDPAALAEQDLERDEYVLRVGDRLLSACRNIIVKFS